jgi:elongation factor P--(R)-beta-lysine ligase
MSHTLTAKLPQYRQRAQVLRAIREFFWQAEFLEVETPQLVPLPSMEPYLEVFETVLEDERGDHYRAFLTSSPEFAMKRLLVAGSGNIFQMCKSYRNREGWSTRHNPEFTILEWYRTHADYTAIMQDCENLFRFVGERLGKTSLSFRGKTYDLTQPWQRLSVAKAFATYAGIDAETLLNYDALIAAAQAKGYSQHDVPTWEEAFHLIFLTEVEPKLGATVPTILYDYPVEMAALSRRKADDPRWAERFEFYIDGLELGNAFSELVDAEEQYARLQADRAEKERLGRTLFDIDMEFIDALRQGMPPTAGIAVGVDRLCMIFLDADTIQDSVLFPATELWHQAPES